MERDRQPTQTVVGTLPVGLPGAASLLRPHFLAKLASRPWRNDSSTFVIQPWTSCQHHHLSSLLSSTSALPRSMDGQGDPISAVLKAVERTQYHLDLKEMHHTSTAISYALVLERFLSIDRPQSISPGALIQHAQSQPGIAMCRMTIQRSRSTRLEIPMYTVVAEEPGTEGSA